MRHHQYEDLITAWTRIQKRYWGLNGESRRPSDDDADLWAIRDFDRLVNDNPDDAWIVIIEILRRDQSPAVMKNLSAGAVEDLLSLHQDLVIDRVEAEAKHNEDFASLLSGVWRSTMSDEIYARVQRVRDKSGWDSAQK